MGRIFFGIAVLFFFFAAVGVSIIPNPSSWGFCSLSLGLLTGGWVPWGKSGA